MNQPATDANINENKTVAVKSASKLSFELSGKRNAQNCSLARNESDLRMTATGPTRETPNTGVCERNSLDPAGKSPCIRSLFVAGADRNYESNDACVYSCRNQRRTNVFARANVFVCGRMLNRWDGVDAGDKRS